MWTNYQNHFVCSDDKKYKVRMYLFFLVLIWTHVIKVTRTIVQFCANQATVTGMTEWTAVVYIHTVFIKLDRLQLQATQSTNYWCSADMIVKLRHQFEILINNKCVSIWFALSVGHISRTNSVIWHGEMHLQMAQWYNMRCYFNVHSKGWSTVNHMEPKTKK